MVLGVVDLNYDFVLSLMFYILLRVLWENCFAFSMFSCFIFGLVKVRFWSLNFDGLYKSALDFLLCYKIINGSEKINKISITTLDRDTVGARET